MSDDFPTREQHERISAMALEFGSVEVQQDSERRLVTVLHGSSHLVIFDEDGRNVTAEHEADATVYIEFPIAVIRGLIGDAPVDAALDACPPSMTRRFALSRYLGEPVVAALSEMAADLAGA